MRPIKVLISFRFMIVWSALALIAAASSGQSILINEIQTSNGTTLADENGDTPDWIELFNPGAEAVHLTGWGLSDTPTNPFKWTFHNATIAPGGFLIVHASNKDRQPGQFAATNPAALAGLKVWLRADAVNTGDSSQVRASAGNLYLKRWEDQSGQDQHAAQSTDAKQPLYVVAAPALGNRPVLRFDGANDALTLPSVPAQNNFCILAVVRSAVSHEIDSQTTAGVGGVSGQRYLFGAQHGGDFNAGAGLSVGTNGASVYEHGANYMPAVAVVGALGGGFAVVSVNYSNRQPFLTVQGTLAAAGSVSSRAVVTAPQEIGAGAYGAFSGEVAEILIFDRALTEAEVRGIEEHLRVKYGLTFPQPFHTNFALDQDGEALLLTRSNGQLADWFGPIEVPRDVSYGRKPDGSASLVFFAQPTPGAPNTTPGATEFLGPPQFSAGAGFYTAPVTLTLTVTNSGAIIRYTTDGSEPTPNSRLYTAPLTLASRVGTPNDISMIPTAGGWQPPLGEVFKIHVVRVRAFRSDAIPSETVTRSYLVDARGLNRYTLPVISLATDRKHFFDPNTGIYVCGNTPGCNFAQSGDPWERPVHVEMFETNGAVAFAQESGVRIHGNTSFGFPIKALRLHPKNQKGRGPFRYRIFPDLPIEEFHRLLLRPSGHDHYLTMMRDGLMQNLIRELGLDMQGYRPAIVFLNGEYWGLHNLQEAFEKNYFALHHPGVDADAVDYLEGYAPSAFAYEGDATHFHNLIAFMQTNDLALSDPYAYVQTQMETGNYMDYKISETFYYRWDIGNHRLWRPRRPDGCWRWIIFDQDVGYGGFWSVPPAYAFNMLAYNLEPNGPWTQYQQNPGGNDHNHPVLTFQLRALLTNPNSRRAFINRCADLMNTTLSTERMTNFINRMAAEIAPEMSEHCARWRAPANFTTWQANVQALRDFALNRPQHMRRHMTNQFGLRGLVNVTLRVSPTNYGSIRINTLDIAAPTHAPWTGIYFRDNPVTLTAQPKPGHRFTGWLGIFSPTNSFTVLLNGNLDVTALFEPLPATNAPAPTPFDLSTGPYRFIRWDESQPAGTYPSNMIFVQTSIPDPLLSDESTNHWVLHYDRTSRSRINGLGADGFAFLNTSDPQADGGGYLGSAVLALNTLGQTNIQVTWRGGTVTPNSRHYAIRLQYRIGATNAFSEVLDGAGQPVEYARNASPGHSMLLGARLPAAASQQPYVQLRWKYYFVTGASGPRDQLRVDDITVAAFPNLAPPPAFTGLQRLENGAVRLQFTGQHHGFYTLQTSTDLAEWISLGGIIADATGLMEWIDLDPGNAPARFYRLRSP